jgi:diphosphomevalonate decarboxylase
VSEHLKATAIAHPNIALVKYWGKRDEGLILPHNSSLSLTIAPLQVTTTVELQARAEQVELDDRPAADSERSRIIAVVAQLEKLAGKGLRPVRIASRGNFPAAAGLASSAAGFAALAVAGRAAAGLAWNLQESSRLARLGSGSACRSVQGGICLWQRGERSDGYDSLAEQLFDASHWPDLRMIAVLLSSAPKEVSSREGMRRSVQSSPFYSAWVTDAQAEIPRTIERIQRRDLAGLGQIAERNAWRMHAVAASADPAICYLLPETLALLGLVTRERSAGLPVWFTLDAGPNPFLITDAAHQAAVERLARRGGASEVICCIPGGDARLTDRHLF